MTNQNDTQDGAERLAQEKYPKPSAFENNNGAICSPNEIAKRERAAFKEGHRAGLSSFADKHLELATKYSDLADKYSALREQLAAEKQKALKLVEALRKPSLNHGLASFESEFYEIREALKDYSTDSGDGGEG